MCPSIVTRFGSFPISSASFFKRSLPKSVGWLFADSKNVAVLTFEQFDPQTFAGYGEDHVLFDFLQGG